MRFLKELRKVEKSGEKIKNILKNFKKVLDILMSM